MVNLYRILCFVGIHVRCVKGDEFPKIECIDCGKEMDMDFFGPHI